MAALRISAPLGALALTLVAASPAGAATQKVSIDFKAMAGSTPVRCDAPITGLGTTKQTAQLRDLRFFVSDVKLLRKGGSSVAVKLTGRKAFTVTGPKGSTTLIDLENGKGACAEEGTPATNATVSGTVPKGTYVGARWTLGVPFALNHTDSVGAPGPLASAAMAWSWQFGRKFMKIELADPAAPSSGAGMKMGMDMPASAAPAATGTWASPVSYVHVGSTGCTGNPATGETVSCLAPNRSNVRMPAFNPAKQMVAVQLRPLFAGIDLLKAPDEMPGCMSDPVDPECGPEFKALGIDWKANGKGTGKPTNSQSVFTVMAR